MIRKFTSFEKLAEMQPYEFEEYLSSDEAMVRGYSGSLGEGVTLFIELNNKIKNLEQRVSYLENGNRIKY